MIDRISPLPGHVVSTASSGKGVAAASADRAGPMLAASQTDFGTVLTGLASSAADAMKYAETTSAAGINGQASVQQVVESVMAAERTLQAGIAIRDKVVSAYLELSRMAI